MAPDEPADARPDESSQGDTYRYDDGTTETVFTVVEGRVFTVREYPSRKAFEAATRDATYRGTNPDVEELDGLEHAGETEPDREV